MADGSPILITGMTRSGTTWVASMLNASGRVVYVNEPLNPQHPPGRSPGLLRADVAHRFQYICNDNDGEYRPAFESMLRFRYHLVSELRHNHRPVDVARAIRHQAMFVRGRLMHRRLMIADPFAVFSAEWFRRTLGFQVVVLVRHPFSIVGSRKRLGWRFDIGELRDQPLLLRDALTPISRRWPEALEPADDLIDEGSTLWRLIYESALDQRARTPELIFVRHEDLAAEPVPAFAALYDRLGLPFTDGARRAVDEATKPGNPTRLAPGDAHGVRLDSRASLASWRERLSPDEVRRIDRITGPVAHELYPDWPPPT